MVLLSHVVHKQAQNTPVDAQFVDCYAFGGYGVDVFFVISGFIVPYVLAVESGSLSHSASLTLARLTYRLFEVPVTRGLNRGWSERVKAWEAVPVHGKLPVPR